MSNNYTKYEFIKRLYSDPLRIGKRGAFLKKHSNRCISVRDLLMDFFKNDLKTNVMDYGCGNGSFIRKLSRLHNASSFYAIDVVPNESIIDNTEAINYKVITPSCFPNYDVTFDVIFCMNVLYHLDSNALVKLFTWFQAILAKQGVIYITTKSGNNFQAFQQLVTTIGRVKKYQPDEISFCSENCQKIVSNSFHQDQYRLERYDLKTQIITKEHKRVFEYMQSNLRYSGIHAIKDKVMATLEQSRFYIDEYQESILRIERTE